MNPDVLKVKELLQIWGETFANECRKNPGKGKYHKADPVRKSEMHWALGGLQPDECRVFLKVYRAKPEIVSFNRNGSFTMKGKRNIGLWNELVSRLNSGPVYLWLVASGARWSYLVRKNGSHVRMKHLNSPPYYKNVLVQTQDNAKSIKF